MRKTIKRGVTRIRLDVREQRLMREVAEIVTELVVYDERLKGVAGLLLAAALKFKEFEHDKNQKRLPFDEAIA